MEISVFKEEKEQLESRLAVLIQAELTRFQETTGYSPHSICVDLMSLHAWGEVKGIHVVTGVHTKVKL